MRSFDTGKANTWCPACGNYGILNAIKMALTQLAENGLDLSTLVMTTGIGCHGKIFDYLNLSGIYGLHGRGVATASGIKIGNPDLKVISFGGDGDSMGEGLEHTLFAAKRNVDMSLFLHNNGNYGLTTGQFSPLSPVGYKGLSSPGGNVEQPFEAVPLLLIAGASFVARAYSANPKHLSLVMQEAIMHPGFAFVEIIQPCVSYNNSYQYYNGRTQIMEDIPSDLFDAIRLAQNPDHTHLGIYRKGEQPNFEQQIPGLTNPARDRLSTNERKDILTSI